MLTSVLCRIGRHFDVSIEPAIAKEGDIKRQPLVFLARRHDPARHQLLLHAHGNRLILLGQSLSRQALRRSRQGNKTSSNEKHKNTDHAPWVQAPPGQIKAQSRHTQEFCDLWTSATPVTSFPSPLAGEGQTNFASSEMVRVRGILSSAEEWVSGTTRIPLIRPLGTFSRKGEKENLSVRQLRALRA